jgi:hypothetical protein
MNIKSRGHSSGQSRASCRDMLTLQHRRRYRRHYRHRGFMSAALSLCSRDIRFTCRSRSPLSLSPSLFPAFPLCLSSRSRSRHRVASLLRAAELKRRYAGEPPWISRSRHEYVCRGMNVHKGSPRVLAALRIHEFIISPRNIVAGGESILHVAARGHRRDPVRSTSAIDSFPHTG